MRICDQPLLGRLGRGIDLALHRLGDAGAVAVRRWKSLRARLLGARGARRLGASGCSSAAACSRIGGCSPAAGHHPGHAGPCCCCCCRGWRGCCVAAAAARGPPLGAGGCAFSSRRACSSASRWAFFSAFALARARSSARRARIAAIRSCERDLEALRRLAPRSRTPRPSAAAAARRPRARSPASSPVLLLRDEGEGVAHHLRAGGAADPVDVVLGDVGDVEVDDVRERLDVDAAGGDVGRHQHLQVAALEAGEGVACAAPGCGCRGCGRRRRRAVEELGEAVRPVLGAGEDQDVLDLPAPQQLDAAARASGPRCTG